MHLDEKISKPILIINMSRSYTCNHVPQKNYSSPNQHFYYYRSQSDY